MNFVPESTEEMLDELENDWSYPFGEIEKSRENVEEAYDRTRRFRAANLILTADGKPAKRQHTVPYMKKIWSDHLAKDVDGCLSRPRLRAKLDKVIMKRYRANRICIHDQYSTNNGLKYYEHS
jgi:hypothetical protein